MWQTRSHSHLFFYSVTINTLQTVHRFVCTFWLKKYIGSLVIGQVLKKMVSTWIYGLRKKIRSHNYGFTDFILVNWWIFCSPLSAPVMVYISTEMKPFSTAKGIQWAAVHIKKAQVHQIKSQWSMSQNFWTTRVLKGWSIYLVCFLAI